jgi:peptidoglycan/xylan/chitin deacetylase (PgdA/CDA1 family)
MGTRVDPVEPSVAIVIPAFNAARTLGETLRSLLSQKLDDWEAVVVNDGSTDDTLAIAENFAREDPRIRVLTCDHSGVCKARNFGAAATRAGWLLFLDADDFITDDHLATLLATTESTPECDAVCSGWARITAAGERTLEPQRELAGDIFPLLARLSAFPIHSCLVRRSLFNQAGGFDPSFATCEDWDLWQRIARASATFASAPTFSALYRMSASSLSLSPEQMLRDGLEVIENGHRPDPRVRVSANKYEQGLSPGNPNLAKVHYLCWCAGLMLGSNRENVDDLLGILGPCFEPTADPSVIAETLLQSVVIPSSSPTSRWVELWPRLQAPIERFLRSLESHARARDLARRAHNSLERLVARKMPAGTITGRTFTLHLEVTEPLPELWPPPECDRVCLQVMQEGRPVGWLELPVFDRAVPERVLADAVSADYAWPLLEQFLQRNIYPQLRLEHSLEGSSVWRDQLLLVNDLSPGIELSAPAVGNQINWTLFLQEIWGQPAWASEKFYDPGAVETAATRAGRSERELTIEVSQDLSTIQLGGDESVRVLLTVGGSCIGAISLRSKEGELTPQELVASLTTAAGFELCRAAVREGLLGGSWADSISMRDRLRSRAAARAAETSHGSESIALLPRRSPNLSGTSVARWAALPASSHRLIDAAAAVNHEPGLRSAADAEKIERIIYSPELLDLTDDREPEGRLDRPIDKQAQSTERRHDRGFFEKIFSRTPDPWRYTSDYERLKYEQTLSLLPSGRIEHALEVACAEGHFTMLLAPRVVALRSVDISRLALERARLRCQSLPNVRFDQLDLVKDDLGGNYDLIVCSEVLFYVGDRASLAEVAEKLKGALRSRGRLILAHANLLVDEPDRAGFDWDLPFGSKVIGETVGSRLRLVREIQTPLYRLQAFQRPSSFSIPWQRKPTREVFSEQPTPPPPGAALEIKWQGGEPKREPSAAQNTARLPIMMYHRVAPDGAEATSRWRLSPERFEEQLGYLKETGFYSASLAQWAAATASRRPLPGRAIILTFDDGYADFRDFAEPILKKFGFSAVLFVVAECVGKENQWDHDYAEKLELMNWDDLRELEAAGFEIGSHSASHPAFSALRAEEIVTEAAGSRATLARHLGAAILSFAYPYGDFDPVAKHVTGSCGYLFGLSCRSGLASLTDDLLALPRVEVSRDLSLAQFINAIHP